ncbi:hypothetical protein [Kitasatospora sp. NPDC088346]|uniref:hypothetical protein n=1 Tax=Kitasatospora sp. NPDC088346 TaxID=3364073 RepID=UPI00382920C4
MLFTLLGTVCALSALLALPSLAGRLGGLAVPGITLGAGPVLWDGLLGHRQVTVRMLPLGVSTSTLPLPVRLLGPRLYLAHLAAFAATLAAGAGAAAAGGDGGFRFAVGLLPIYLLLVLGQARHPLTTGWVLFLMPFRSALLGRLTVHPAELAAGAALDRGDAARAAALLAARPAGTPDGLHGHRIRAGVALARGDYAQAAREAVAACEAVADPKAAVSVRMLLAAALTGAAESGELPAAEYLPRLRDTAARVREGHRAALPYFPLAAELALAEGRRDAAVRAARKAAGLAFNPFWRAQAECTHAAALASVGRTDEARAALERARTAMPALARIAVVAGRMELLVVTEARPVSP